MIDQIPHPFGTLRLPIANPGFCQDRLDSAFNYVTNQFTHPVSMGGKRTAEERS